MAFCPNCGTQVAGRFCPNCGSDVGAAASEAGAGPAFRPPTGPSPMAASSSGLSENVASALCYLAWFVTGILFLLLRPYNQNRTIRFHAWQSIFVTLAAFIIDWVVGILIGVLHMWVIGFSLFSLLHLLWIVLWLYLMYSAYNNRKVKLPVVGDLAEKQA